jgi:NADH-quinone oxidoreductase subunit J
MSQEVLMYIGFFGLAGLTLLSALAVVTLRNLLHSALALAATFIGVAGIYLLLQAEFIAVVQVLIYVGAITVLILFAIMLTRRLMQRSLYQFTAKWWLAAPLALLLFAGLMVPTLVNARWLERSKETMPADAVATLGNKLMTTWALPFEIASVLLLVALVGAIVVAWPAHDRLPAVEEMEKKVHEAKERAEDAET